MTRILLILPEVPWPPVTGGKRAHLATITRLLEYGCTVKIVACNIDTSDEDVSDFLAGPHGSYTTIIPTASPARSKTRWQLIRSFFIALISIYPSHYIHLRRSAARSVIATKLQNESFDCVWVDHLYALAMAPEIGNGARLVLSTQNIESDLTIESAKQAPWGFRKAKRYIDYLKVAFWEPRLLSRANAIVTLSSKDAETIEERYGFRVVGALFPFSREPESKWLPPKVPILTFVGSYDFPPNQDAIKWIIEHFSHWLFSENPNITIRIIGGGTIPISLRTSAPPNIQFLGKLPDPDFQKILTESSALLSPIVLGSGIKMKIVDSALLGVPIIATTFSSAGLSFIKYALLIENRCSREISKRISQTISNDSALIECSKRTIESLKNLQKSNIDILSRLLLNSKE